MKTATAILAALAALPIVAHAQGTSPSSSTAGSSVLNTVDQRFVKDVADANLTEIALSELALQHSQRQDVKDLAQHMVDDHTKANGDLTKLATTDNIDVPTQPSARHQQTADRLGKLDGAKFDQAYIRNMVKDHDTAVKLFNQEIAAGRSQDVIAWAKTTLPTIQQHDDTAKKLQANPQTASR